MSAAVVRRAHPDDVDAVVARVHELADHERAPDACTLTGDQLADALFPASPALDVYASVGAVGMDEWTVHRVTGDALAALARPPGVPR